MDISKEREKLDDLKKERENLESKLKIKLMTFRGEIIASINEHNRQISLKNDELKEINGQICSMFGHNFTSWEMHDDQYRDRSWYYERECKICNKTEMSYEEPKEYKASSTLTYSKNKIEN